MKSESENNKKLQEFFGKEYQSLRAYISSKIRDTASRDAEDILQDVALSLFSGADRYAPINNVAGFVYRSIKNKIIDVMRVQAPTNIVHDEGWVKLSESLVNTEDSGFLAEEIILLKKCIDELKPAYKDIIIAVDIEGYSYKEISKQTGISQGTLMSRRHRAIGILSKKVEIEINNLK